MQEYYKVVKNTGLPFEKLSNTYRDVPNVKLESGAIANTDGMVKMYRVVEMTHCRNTLRNLPALIAMLS